MEGENKKVGFLTRIKIAVAKLENYTIFLEEKLSVAVKYFFLIVFILSLVIAAVQTFDIMKMVNKGYQYIQNELADFSYEDGKLNFSERIYAYDEEYDMYMIADTVEEISEEVLQEYKNEIKSSGLIFLSNKVIYKNAMTQIEYLYSDLSAQYGMNSLDKATLIQEIQNIGIIGIAITMFLVFLISVYMVQLIAIFMDWLMITIFAFIAARICRIYMTFKQCFQISIYALTLSIILSMLYNIAYTIAGFYTEYFRIVYLLISYVYIVAVILMIKSDLLKQQVEVGQIVEVQKKIHEELKNPEDKEEEKKENKKPKEQDNPEDKNENPTNEQPDGSEI